MKRTHITLLITGYFLIALFVWAYKWNRLPIHDPGNRYARPNAMVLAYPAALLWPAYLLLELALHLTKPTPPPP